MRKLLLLLALVSSSLFAQVTTSSVVTGVSNTGLTRDSASVVSQRSDGISQAFHVYNTFTDAANYERAVFDWSITTNALTFITQASGTGTARPIRFGVGSAQWQITGANNITPLTTGTVGLGSASLGVSKIYVDYTNTGTVGAVTINKASGRVNLAAAGTSLVVTNSTVTAAAHCFLNADGAPGNVVAVQLYAVAAAGSLTINAVPAVTNQTAIDFFCVNAD